MWVHGDISRWLSAGATQNTPLNLRVFEVYPTLFIYFFHLCIVCRWSLCLPVVRMGG